MNLALRLQKLREQHPDPADYQRAVEQVRAELEGLHLDIAEHIVRAVVPYVAQYILNRFDIEELGRLAGLEE